MNQKENNKDLSFKKIFLLFIIFSLIGCLYEDIYFMIKKYIKYGTWKFVTKRGLLYFELSPIYGVGACIIIYLLSIRNNKKFDYFWKGALIGGIFEYIASIIQQFFTETISWDYSNYFLNINGRTTIPYMIFWGIISYLLMTKIYPSISKQLKKIPKKIETTFFWITLIIIILDIFISFTACVRMGQRHKGYKPLTEYGEFLDKVYNDERIYQSYTNMRDKK